MTDPGHPRRAFPSDDGDAPHLAAPETPRHAAPATPRHAAPETPRHAAPATPRRAYDAESWETTASAQAPQRALPEQSDQPDPADAPTDFHPPARALLDPDESPAPPDPDAAPRRLATPAHARRRSFGPSVGWTLLGTLLPGAGLLRTRYRGVGIALVTLTVLAGALAALGLFFARGFLLGLLVQPTTLTVVWIGLVILGVVWVITIATTHLALRPAAPHTWQRLSGSVIVGLCSLLVAVPAFAGARSVYDTASFVGDVFTPTKPGVAKPIQGGTFGNPWATKPRLNVLVLGGDSGRNRKESLGARTDTVILASIDTATGDTVLFGLPRQTGRMPFPEGSPMAKWWPYGFTDGNPNNPEYFLNSIYDNVPAFLGQDVLGDVKDPGAEVLKQSVGTALGLDVDYYVMINMDGFIEFINALGGITVNISKPVAMGGVTDRNIPPDRWLHPGPNQHLDGYEALWFARGRYGTEDYERMSRQRCVIQAVAKQASPWTVLANYESLTRAGRNIIATDVPPDMLAPMVELGLKVKDKSFRSVSFENGKHGFSTVHPDWDLVRGIVSDALDPTLPITPTPSPTPTEDAGPTPSDEPTPDASPTPDSPIGSTEDECAYHPVPYDPDA